VPKFLPWLAAAMCAALTLSVGCDRPARSTSNGPSFEKRIRRAQRQSRPESQTLGLLRIAREQMKAQMMSGAGKTLRLAQESCQQIKDPLMRVSAQCRLAEMYIRLNDDTQAVNQLSQAEAEVDALDVAADRVIGLSRVARSQAAVGLNDAALETLATAEGLANGMPQTDDPARADKVTALAALARSFHALEEEERVRSTFEAALESAVGIDDARERCRALSSELAVRLASMGRQKDAAAAFDRALEQAGAIDEPLQQAHALADIARDLADAKLDRRAQQVLDQAQDIAEQIGAPDLKKEVQARIRQQFNTLRRG